MIEQPRVIITRPLPGDPVGRLAEAGVNNVWINPDDRRLERAELLEAVAGAHAALVTPADMHVDGAFFDAAGPQLAIVSAYAVGVDNIDLAEARRRNILVGHTPHTVTEPTADIAWLLILAAARQALRGHAMVTSGTWSGVKPMDLLGKRLVGKTLFIIGAGRIGTATARRAPGWNMTVLYHSRHRHDDIEQPPINGSLVTLDEGLRQADVVSIHTPLTPETRHMIGAAELSMMKPSAVLVNTARGAVIDEAALVDALRERRIFGAGLDVFENEPSVHPGLLELDNVFLLPHWGSATDEARGWMTEMSVDNVIAAMRGETPAHVV